VACAVCLAVLLCGFDCGCKQLSHFLTTLLLIFFTTLHVINMPSKNTKFKTGRTRKTVLMIDMLKMPFFYSKYFDGRFWL
jgi:hypothetical protein